jgi:DNA-binding IclR family transcriptional regulator
MNLNALAAELKLMNALYNRGIITFDELVAKSGLAAKTVRKYMPRFEAAGLCRREGDHYCTLLICGEALAKVKKQFRAEVNKIDWRLK